MISIKAVIIGALLAAFTNTLSAASPASPPPPEPSFAPSLDHLRGIPSPRVLSVSEIAETFGSNLDIHGVAPKKVVQPDLPAGSKDSETVVIAYYDQPEGEVAPPSSTNITLSDNLPIPGSESLQRRGCGDNWDGGCDRVNNRADDGLCDGLLRNLRGAWANDVSSLAVCSYKIRHVLPGKPHLQISKCCTTWRGGHQVAGWQLANGVESIRNRCRSGGLVSGWINVARLGNHCTAQCLSTVSGGC